METPPLTKIIVGFFMQKKIESLRNYVLHVNLKIQDTFSEKLNKILTEFVHGATILHILYF